MGISSCLDKATLPAVVKTLQWPEREITVPANMVSSFSSNVP